MAFRYIIPIGNSPRNFFIVNLGLFLLALFITLLVPLLWVSSERFFYYWDLAMYQNRAIDTAALFVENPLGTLYQVYLSTGSDLSGNNIFAIPLIPFILFFGESRLVYIISISLVYLLPFALVVGGIATKLVEHKRFLAFWITTFLTLLTSMVWAPTLLGWPDVGAALFIAISVLVYLLDVNLSFRWQIPVIGFFIALAALFRRPFSYACLAFFVSLIFLSLFFFIRDARYSFNRALLSNLYRRLVKVTLVGLSSILFLTIVGFPFLYNSIVRDYSVHESFMRPISENFIFYVSQYGWLSLILAILGFTLGILTRNVISHVAVFLLLLLGTSFGLWIFVVRIIGVQYNLFFALSIILGITALVWTISRVPYRMLRGVMLSMILLYAVFNFIVGLAPINFSENKFVGRAMFAANYPPLMRSDYDEVVGLINYLRSVASDGEPIYVVGSSVNVNPEILKNAELLLFGRGNTVLNILRVPQVDSRDFYQGVLENMLKARYVLLAKPLQYHLVPEEQDVVKVAFTAFEEEWEISKDFILLPERFFLVDDITVYVYKRIQSTSLATALRTLKSMVQFSDTYSARQTDWIVFSELSIPYTVRKIKDGYSLRVYLSAHPQLHDVLFLYTGTLPGKQVVVSGRLEVGDTIECKDLALGFLLIDEEYKVVDTAEFVYKGNSTAFDFKVPINTKDATYLLVRISTTQNTLSGCSPLEIDGFAVLP